MLVGTKSRIFGDKDCSRTKKIQNP